MSALSVLTHTPPGFYLIVGALLIASSPGKLHKMWSLVAPLVTLAVIWMFPTDQRLAFEWLDYRLIVAQVNLPTRAFATIFSIMAFAGALFAYNQDRRVELSGAMLYAGSAIGVTFAGDLMTLFIFWELMAIGSTVVVWAGGGEAARKAGRRYVNVHLVGGAILMAGIALHVTAGGSLALPQMSMGATLDDPVALTTRGGAPWTLPQLDSPGAWLMLIGVLINAGAPPFGSWLPDAYPEASPSGTVFLSAFTTKTSVYVLIVLFAGCNVLVWVGSLMAVYGIVYAILENDMRRILAYSIVNQVGFMVCAVGIGTGLSVNGATAHAFAHIIYKALLLMSAGSVLYMTGKRKCTDLGGLYKAMPVTMWCGIIGALAISAMPLTSGFTTKSMITDASAQIHLWAPTELTASGETVWATSFGLHPSIAWFVLVAASAGVFLHAGIKFPWFVFFQKPAPANDDRKLDPPKNMQAAMLLFSLACVAIGIVPGPLYEFLPFNPQNAGVEHYHAYNYAHVVNQLQLLLFSGLAFFLLLGLLKRTLTITLDFDWIYRRMFPGLWQWIFRPLLLAAEPFHRGATQALPRIAAKEFGAGSRAAGEDNSYRPWGVGRTVLLLTVVLLAFLVLNLFGD
ncbi:Na(+)/H(+) antiporter subunit D [Pseudenhygromyxa sp. WMMC2535]|uniref:Na(+)/H(+) antiporter subunit D n=1 Tax=Pseudenhygromyxa sp. WMMC2535 TaxID=2712867 RepID=UPI00155689A8|nr:Na(+)/H(+) antiporter subunit D [Pseudenhygromyxa sp. WMMC2535]NVB42418.1 Na(+)/H(+) antiporter subunit D [Pseudenhygromyxa sp. WMMC2535]